MENLKHLYLRSVICTFLGLIAVSACTPRLEVAAPDKPIEINLNVNIEHRVKVEIEKDLENSIQSNSSIF